jgi:hypothetical protein
VFFSDQCGPWGDEQRLRPRKPDEGARETSRITFAELAEGFGEE